MHRFLIICISLVLLTGCDQKQAQKNALPAAAKGQDHMTQGLAFLQKQDVPRAIQSFDLAIKQDPANVENYLVLGQVYMKLKVFERAIDTFSAATKVAPNSGEAHYLLATAKALDGRMDSAIKSTQRSIELFVAQKDEENFKKSVALLKGLTETEPASIEQ